MTRDYINGYRETPRTLERLMPDGRTFQVYCPEGYVPEDMRYLLAKIDTADEARGGEHG